MSPPLLISIPTNQPIVPTIQPKLPSSLTLDSIYNSADLGKSTLFASLYLSAAFDTIDHSILLRCLKISFGIDGLVLNFISSYLSNRTQFIQLGQSKSSISPCTTGVPQGSVLGPLLFSLFISPVSSIAAFHKVSEQQYADDTKLFIALSQSNFDTFIVSIQTALMSLYSWFSYNGLALYYEQSDTIFLGTSKRNSSLRHITSVNITSTQITLSNHLKLLEVTLDFILNLNKHVSSICRSSYFHLQVLHHIRHAINDDIAKALVSFKLEYAILYSVSQFNINKLQKVPNTGPCSATSLQPY